MTSIDSCRPGALDLFGRDNRLAAQATEAIDQMIVATRRRADLEKIVVIVSGIDRPQKIDPRADFGAGSLPLTITDDLFQGNGRQPNAVQAVFSRKVAR